MPQFLAASAQNTGVEAKPAKILHHARRFASTIEIGVNYPVNRSFHRNSIKNTRDFSVIIVTAEDTDINYVFENLIY